MPDLALARHNMVEQQIRPWEVLDQKVLDVLEAVPREDFVPSGWRNLAYVDEFIPLPGGEVMLPPRIEARLLQALDVQPEETVLEVGTGSGYFTALLAKLARHVYSVEIDPELSASAGEKLREHGIANVTLEVGDAARGWDRHAPYNAIAITGSLPELPDAFREQLTIGGRLVAIVGEAPVMEAVLIRRLGESEWSEEFLFETVVPPLKNAPGTNRFRF